MNEDTAPILITAVPGDLTAAEIAVVVAALEHYAARCASLAVTPGFSQTIMNVEARVALRLARRFRP